MTIGGSVCIRNGNELDYCWRQCIQSLLPICNEVVVCDGESTDGTQEEVREWLKSEPKLKLCVYPWPNPKGNPDFWVDWLNFSRVHLKTDWHLQLDADEVLHENSYEQIGRFVQLPNQSAICTRYNFWRDSKHLIPDGVCCGKHVIRLAPQRLWMASDGAHANGSEVAAIGRNTGIEIGHYGFLRKRKAFFEKAKALQGYFFNSYDPRLAKAETHEGNWMQMDGICGWENKLDDFRGTHPKWIHTWLKERNYEF